MGSERVRGRRPEATKRLSPSSLDGQEVAHQCRGDTFPSFADLPTPTPPPPPSSRRPHTGEGQENGTGEGFLPRGRALWERFRTRKSNSIKDPDAGPGGHLGAGLPASLTPGYEPVESLSPVPSSSIPRTPFPPERQAGSGKPGGGGGVGRRGCPPW